jgi:HAD superfamily hydrolase (TIGR01484 family)
MPRPKLVAFDLDDTLAPSKSPVPDDIASLLAELLGYVDVAVISGGAFPQFRTQVVERLPEIGSHRLSNLHLLPVCGTQYYRLREDTWQLEYSHELSAEQKARAVAALTARAKELGLWAERTWGPIIEDRASQITFSALGQLAPVEIKAQWDPSGEKKNRLRAAVALDLPDLEVRSGGSTSVDITRRGVDKAFGMARLSEFTGFAFEDMLFVGDRLDPDGNDYPVKVLGVPCHAVSDWEDTVRFVTALLPSLADTASRPR